MNTPRPKPFASKAERAARPRRRAACRSGRRRSCRSWWTPACAARAACREADYFLWNDDFEFTTRLLRGQAGLLCPASVVVHKTADVRLDRRRPRAALLLRGAEQGLDAQDRRRRWPRPSGCCTAARRCAAGPAPSRSSDRARPTGARPGGGAPLAHERCWLAGRASLPTARLLADELPAGRPRTVAGRLPATARRPCGCRDAVAVRAARSRRPARRRGDEGDHGGQLVPPGELVDVRRQQDHHGGAGEQQAGQGELRGLRSPATRRTAGASSEPARPASAHRASSGPGV